MKHLRSLSSLVTLPHLLHRHRVILSWLLILALFGFTLIRAQAISNPEVDNDYLREQRREQRPTTLNIDEDLRQQIDSLLTTPVNTEPDNLGTRDPFNP